MVTREERLQQFRTERRNWIELLDEVGEDRMEEPGPMGDWTFKDLTAHLTVWNERAIDRLEAPPGTNPPTPWPAALTTDDEINDWIYEQHQDRPLSDVLTDFDESYLRLANLIETMPEEALMTPGYFGINGLEETAVVDMDFFGHFHEEHEPSVRAWLASARPGQDQIGR